MQNQKNTSLNKDKVYFRPIFAAPHSGRLQSKALFTALPSTLNRRHSQPADHSVIGSGARCRVTHTRPLGKVVCRRAGPRGTGGRGEPPDSAGLDAAGDWNSSFTERGQLGKCVRRPPKWVRWLFLLEIDAASLASDRRTMFVFFVQRVFIRAPGGRWKEDQCVERKLIWLGLWVGTWA